VETGLTVFRRSTAMLFVDPDNVFGYNVSVDWTEGFAGLTDRDAYEEASPDCEKQ